MTRYETEITIPCSVGDQFWIFDKRESQAVQVECTGYVISKDSVTGRDVAYLWVDGITARGQWQIQFHEFYSRCYKTKKEATHCGRQIK